MESDAAWTHKVVDHCRELNTKHMRELTKVDWALKLKTEVLDFLDSSRDTSKSYVPGSDQKKSDGPNGSVLMDDYFTRAEKTPDPSESH